eukprot:Awhi_evm1s13204
MLKLVYLNPNNSSDQERCLHNGDEAESVEILVKWAFSCVSDILFDHIPTEIQKDHVIEATDLLVREISHRTW